MKPEITTLHNEAVLISKNLHRQEFLMIEVLQRIDDKKVYRFLGFKSLYQYATVALKLSDSRAYTFILVSRKASKLSKMQEALKSGTLSLSQAKRVSSVISKENQDHWLKLAKTLSQRSLEHAVVRQNPKAAVQEGARFISENTLEFRVAITQDTEMLIKRSQDLLSQSQGKAVSFDEVLRAMAKEFLEKRDPMRRAQRILSKKIKTTAQKLTAPKGIELNSQGAASKNKSQGLFFRKPLSNKLKHQVFFRDQGKCQVNSCGDGRWVDIHHIKEVSRGGENILENLMTLCRAHHQMQHEVGTDP